MTKGKIERRKFIEMKQGHAKLCREKQEIKDRNEVLKYIKRERQQREPADEDIEEEEWIGHSKNLLEDEKKNKRDKQRSRKERRGRDRGVQDYGRRHGQSNSKTEKEKGSRGRRHSKRAWINADKKTKEKLRSIIQKVCNGPEIPKG